MQCWCNWSPSWIVVTYRPKSALYFRAWNWWSTWHAQMWWWLSFAALFNGSTNLILWFDSLIKEKKTCLYLSKSKSQRRKTSSRTDRFRCGNKDDSISIAFCETSGDLDVEDTEEDSNFFFEPSGDLASAIDELDVSVLGSVTVMPKILPGGKESIALPVSVDASRNAIASSTACCRFSATCENKFKKSAIKFQSH